MGNKIKRFKDVPNTKVLGGKRYTRMTGLYSPFTSKKKALNKAFTERAESKRLGGSIVGLFRVVAFQAPKNKTFYYVYSATSRRKK